MTRWRLADDEIHVGHAEDVGGEALPGGLQPPLGGCLGADLILADGADLDLEGELLRVGPVPDRVDRPLEAAGGGVVAGVLGQGDQPGAGRHERDHADLPRIGRARIRHRDRVDRIGIGAPFAGARDGDRELGFDDRDRCHAPRLLALLLGDDVGTPGADGTRLIASPDRVGDQGIDLLGLAGGQHGDRLGDHLVGAPLARSVPEPGAQLGRDRDLAPARRRYWSPRP